MRLLRSTLTVLLLAWCAVAQAGFSAGMVWDVRQTGSDANNGGGFRGGAALATPSAPAVAGSGTGGTVAAGTYYVVVTGTDGNGETPKSAETSVTTTGTTSTITVTAPTNPVVQGSTWNVYVGTASGGPYFSQGTGLIFTANRSITATPPTTGTQPPGVDYSQQDAAQVTYTDLVIDGTTNTKATSAGNPFTPAHVGNVINVTSGTGFTVQRVEIVGVTAGVATMDKSLGTLSSTGGNGKLGGALGSPGLASGLTSGNNVFVKYSATPYDCTASGNVSGGKVALAVSGFLVGYDTTRSLWNTDANRPTLRAAANSMVLVAMTGNADQMLRNVILDGNAHTSVTGFQAGSNSTPVSRCKATGMATGFDLTGFTAGAEAADCQADACTAAGFTVGSNPGASCDRCSVTNQTGGTGFNINNSGMHINDCIVKGTGGTGVQVNFGVVRNVSVYGVSTGFQIFNGKSEFVNCVAYNCTTNYNRGSSSGRQARMINCAGGGSGSNFDAPGANGWQASQIVGFIALSADPFINAAGNDFSLNGNAGGGSLLRGTGYPSNFPGLSTNAYPDVGAAQHRSPGHAR